MKAVSFSRMARGSVMAPMMGRSGVAGRSRSRCSSWTRTRISDQAAWGTTMRRPGPPVAGRNPAQPASGMVPSSLAEPLRNHSIGRP